MPPMPRPATSAVTLTPEIVEDDDQRDGEHHDVDQHADQRHRIAERRGARILADPAADHADDDLPRPDRDLERGGDDEEDVGEVRQLGRDGGVADDDVDRRRDHEEDAGLGQHPADDAAPAPHLGLVGQQAMADPAHRQHHRDDRRGDQRADRQPVEVGDDPVEHAVDLARRGRDVELFIMAALVAADGGKVQAAALRRWRAASS